MMHCHCSICGTCGSLVPRERDPGAMQVPAGSLDTDPGRRRAANIFTGSMAPRATLDEGIACFEAYPAPA